MPEKVPEKVPEKAAARDAAAAREAAPPPDPATAHARAVGAAKSGQFATDPADLDLGAPQGASAQPANFPTPEQEANCWPFKYEGQSYTDEEVEGVHSVGNIYVPLEDMTVYPERERQTVIHKRRDPEDAAPPEGGATGREGRRSRREPDGPGDRGWPAGLPAQGQSPPRPAPVGARPAQTHENAEDPHSVQGDPTKQGT